MKYDDSNWPIGIPQLAFVNPTMVRLYDKVYRFENGKFIYDHDDTVIQGALEALNIPDPLALLKRCKEVFGDLLDAASKQGLDFGYQKEMKKARTLLSDIEKMEADHA